MLHDEEPAVNMKVLWIVNCLLPKLAEHLNAPPNTSGTWMINLSEEISRCQDITLGIACVYGETFLDTTIDGIRYFCIPGNGKSMLFYNPGLIKYWDNIEALFCPDIIHYHGTEYSHGISYLRKYPNKKKLLTIQGIIAETSRNHWGGLPLKVVLGYRTLNEYLHFNGMLERKILARFNVKYEKEIISNIQYATGRTDWDRFYMEAINPDIHYYRCYYDLREEFYDAPKWDICKIKRNVIFASTSAQVPMKGGHIVLKALSIIKEKISDIKVIFLSTKQVDGRLIPTSGYTKYILHLIEKYKLENNVEFVNQQDCKGIISLMTQSHITLVPSAIENASATLREAMHLGAPCVASFRGGMTELVKNGENGFLYDYDQAEFLAGRIVQLLCDDEMACMFSQNAITAAATWHNKEKNKTDYINLYRTISGEEKE